MKKCLMLLAVVFIAVAFSGCALLDQFTEAPQVQKSAEYHKVSAEEAKAMMDNGHMLLDVRTEAEFLEGHIPGAMLIPDNEIAARAQGALPDQDALILVYCRSGRRSALAAKELVSQGYTNVYDFGGIIDWPYEVVDGDKN